MERGPEIHRIFNAEYNCHRISQPGEDPKAFEGGQRSALLNEALTKQEVPPCLLEDRAD
jgi:hypothetical protein